MIRYRRSLDSKPCGLGIEERRHITRPQKLRTVEPGKPLSVCSLGGLRIARLKLKRIDGKAQQGVECAA